MLKMSNCMIGLWLLTIAASLAAAESPDVRLFDWRGMHDAELLGGKVISGAEGEADVLRIEKVPGGSKTIPLFVREGIVPKSGRIALIGEIRYEGVDEPGHMEMWVVLPDGSRYFSRTVAEAGPMRLIEGHCDWRPILLPFHFGDDIPESISLEVNLILPGSGEVELAPLRLEDPWVVGGAVGGAVGGGAAPSRWFSDRVGGWICGIVGVTMGLAFPALGRLSSNPRARNGILALHALIFAIGLLGAIAGVIAVASGQPYGVFLPLILSGGLTVFFVFHQRRRTQSRVQAELRKMQAMDR